MIFEDSHKAEIHGATLIGPAPIDVLMKVSVTVPRHHSEDLLHKPGDPPELRRQRLIAHRATIYSHHMKKIPVALPNLRHIVSKPHMRVIDFEGTVDQINRTFGVTINEYRDLRDGHTFYSYVGYHHIPDELDGMVECVLGLNTRKACYPRMR